MRRSLGIGISVMYIFRRVNDGKLTGWRERRVHSDTPFDDRSAVRSDPVYAVEIPGLTDTYSHSDPRGTGTDETDGILTEVKLERVGSVQAS